MNNTVIEKVFKSTEFKNAHSTTKEILKMTLKDLDKQKYLQDSDYANLMLLVSSMDMYYRMKEDVQNTGLTYVNQKGLTVASPLISAMAAQHRASMAILNELGGSTKSRRALNVKDMQKAENNEIDALMSLDNQSEVDDFCSDAFSTL